MIQLKYYLISGIVLISPLLGSNLTGQGITQLLDIKPLETIVEPPEAIKDPVLVELIDKISWCESSDREDVEIVDTNGYYSRGIMQFQMATFAQALKDLGYEVGDHETLRNQMLDGEYAKKIAYEWIAEDFSRIHNWSCYKIIQGR